jgi:serine/threonine-protein kinase
MTYKFSRRIGRGGMAEVFMGMREGLGGFEKLVVIKRIFSHFCEDERFIKMFLDEARLAASIRHPNVVEILDIDRDQSGHFIVMEYLSGETLALMFETLRAQQVTMPAPIVARVCADVAAGLHYAHTATDNNGTPLGIVHRDVTPSNLIVCFNGITKIVDFGIAKAELRDAQTRSGALKGKMAYLSPEQIEDTKVDPRTDVFQLGICLHEMLTGTRLFDAEGDHQKMMAVMERPIRPPSEVNPYVPKAFDEVVLRALSRDFEKRTPSADQLRRDLEQALKKIGTTVSDHDVADWMQSTFAQRYTERVAMERDCVQQMRSGAPASSGELPVGDRTGGGHTPTLATVVARPTTKTRRRSSKSRKPAMMLGIGAGVGALVGAILFISSKASGPEGAGALGDPSEASAQKPIDPPEEPPPPAKADKVPTDEPYKVSIKLVPARATVELDGEEAKKQGRYFRSEFLADGSTHRLTVSASGYETQVFEFSDETEAPPKVVTGAPRSAILKTVQAKSRRAARAKTETRARQLRPKAPPE